MTKSLSRPVVPVRGGEGADDLCGVRKRSRKRRREHREVSSFAFRVSGWDKRFKREGAGNAETQKRTRARAGAENEKQSKKICLNRYGYGGGRRCNMRRSRGLMGR